MSTTAQSRLPFELILQIIDCLIPSPLPIALPASHPTTKTLLSLARTCRSLHPTAIRMLYGHCLYVDYYNHFKFRSLWMRLQLASNTVHEDQRLLSFSCSTHENYLAQTKSPSFALKSIPRVPILQYTSSLYLSPHVIRGSDHHIFWTYDLLCFVAPVLRRLIIDLPLRSLSSDDAVERGLQRSLKQAFLQLSQLESFCCVRDELYLGDFEEWGLVGGARRVWACWPKLRHLALYNVVADMDFWQDVARSKQLDTLVLTRADGLDETDIMVGLRLRNGDAQLCVILVNVENDHPTLLGKDTWMEKERKEIREVNVPTSFYGDDDVIELCQEWVERRLLRGDVNLES